MLSTPLMTPHTVHTVPCQFCTRSVPDLCRRPRESHLVAEGGVPVQELLRAAVYAGPGGALGQRGGVLLSLTLLHDGLAALPLAHGPLVAQTHLLVHLHEVKGQQFTPTMPEQSRGTGYAEQIKALNAKESQWDALNLT